MSDCMAEFRWAQSLFEHSWAPVSTVFTHYTTPVTDLFPVPKPRRGGEVGLWKNVGGRGRVQPRIHKMAMHFENVFLGCSNEVCNGSLWVERCWIQSDSDHSIPLGLPLMVRITTPPQSSDFPAYLVPRLWFQGLRTSWRQAWHSECKSAPWHHNFSNSCCNSIMSANLHQDHPKCAVTMMILTFQNVL